MEGQGAFAITTTSFNEPGRHAVVSGTKSVSGLMAEGGTITYSVTLSNTGTIAQADNAGDEFTDVLPGSVTLVSASATSGTAFATGNTVTWNGSIAVGASVTITIQATVNGGTAAQLISNQGTIAYDADNNGTNEATVSTDDPTVPGATNPTVFQVASNAVNFFTITPCRVIDTRTPAGPLGGPALGAGTDRTFTVIGTCGIPPTAKAISVNLAVTLPTVAGNLRLRPGGTTIPLVASIVYAAGQTRSNNALVPLNPSGQIGVYCAQASGTVAFILDVNGYFE
jgi:uncharacterized repeat protein (TIGR01451 family)